MMEDMKPQAIKRIETRLVLEAIAKAENIEISDERIDEELAKKWLANGAQPTEVVAKLLKNAGIEK